MFKLFVLLLGVTFTVEAYAIGVTIAAAIGLTAFNATLGAIAAFAINMAVSFVVSKVLMPSNTNPGATADQGVRLQVPPDPTRSIPVVYGDAYIGGKFVDAVMTTNNNTMYYVMAISSISNDGQFTFDKTKFYYGDRLVTFDTTNPSRVMSLTDGAGNVDTKIAGTGTGLLNIYLFRSNAAGVITNLDVGGTSSSGVTPQNIMSIANGVPSGQEWAASGRQMNGLAFAIIKLVYNRDAETTQLQPVTFYAKHYLRNTGVAKPGDVWYDYMTNTIYGAAVDPAFVDYTSATALNAYSDELITFTNQGGTPVTQPRYRINGVLDTNQNILQNVDQVMTACDSWMTYQETSGKWSIVVNKAESSSFAFNDSNIIGSITVGGMDITSSVNQIEARFPDGSNRDQFNYVYIETPSGLLYANEPVNKTNVNYDLVNNSVQASYLANRFLEQAREDLNVTINTTYAGIQVNAGDVVSITNQYYGWNAKLFRVMQVREASLEDGNLGAQIQMAEYNAAVYDNFDITAFAPSPNTGLVSAGYFSALNAPTVVDVNYSAAVPNFSVQATIPAIGRVTNTTLFYTTTPTPLVEQWQVLDIQTLINSQTFPNNTSFVFSDLSLPAGTYYFAYKVGNDVGQSSFSPLSSAFNWTPSVVAAETFFAAFSPSAILVPYDGSTATFTNAITRLNGSTYAGQTQFVAAQTDSDASFVNDTWRIGGSSTTGYGSITKTNITIGNPSVNGLSALFPIPTAMSSNSASISVPVRYKDSIGVVYQMSPASVQYVYAQQGSTGNKTVSTYLYQWSTATPVNPSGTSTYNWTTNTNTSYTGTGGWSVDIPANPGVPNIYLWQAIKTVTASGTATTTTVDWTTGVTIGAVTQNGLAGTQTAQPTVYQWAVTIPTPPSGTSTYTWSTGTFTPTPSSWTLTPGTSPSPGYTLWGAEVTLLTSATATTSTINWTTASITARGYSGSNGTSGSTGASARICYAKVTGSSLNATPTTVTTTGSTSFPPTNTWGGNEVWQATVPTYVAGESVFQSDGIYNPATNQTVWNVPYLSALKVGALSAISANLGTMTAGSITAEMITSGTISADRIGTGSITAEKIDSRNLTIKNSAGTTIFAAGSVIGSGNIARNSDFLQEYAGVPTYFYIYNNAAISITSYTHSGGALGNSRTWVIIANAATSSTFGFYFSAIDLFGGWKANTNYILSFYARGSGLTGATFSPAWNNAPASFEWLQNPGLSGGFQRYVGRINYGNNTIDPNGYIYINSYVPAGAYLEFSCVAIEQGDAPSGWSPPALDAFNKITSSNVSTYIASAAIDNAQIANLDAYKINTGYLSADRIQGNTITADKIDSRNLTIKDASGNIIFGAGNNLDWSRIQSQPSSIYNSNISINTNGTLSGAGGGQVSLGGLGAGNFAFLNQISAANISTYIATAAIGGAYIAEATIATANIGVAQIDTLRIAGNAVTITAAAAGTSTSTVYLSASQGGLLNLIMQVDQSGAVAADQVFYVYINGLLYDILQGNQVVIGNTGGDSGTDIYAYSEVTRVRSVAVGAGTTTVTFASPGGRFYTAIAMITQR